MSKRFSRDTLLITLEAWAAEIERQYGWNDLQGRNVVDGCSTDAKIDFGRYECIRDLIEEFQP